MTPLKPIVETRGFRNIATAMRQSTVTQQFYKVRQNDNTYEIRYGLAEELRRKSRDDKEFIRAISEFLQQYAQENARVSERHKEKPYRKRIGITTEDLTQLVELVDTYGAPTVAALLSAYGYAYDPRTPEATAEATDEGNLTPTDEIVPDATEHTF